MLNGLPRNWLGEPGIQVSAKLSALLARRNILLHNVVGNMRQFIGTPPCSILPYSRWLRSSESGSDGGAWPPSQVWSRIVVKCCVSAINMRGEGLLGCYVPVGVKWRGV